MDRRPGKATNWLDRVNALGLFGIYCAVLIAAPIIGAILFFFPILQIYTLLGWEFSNLGPIATFFMGILFDIYVVTPVFILLALLKLYRKMTHSDQ